jgi:hypothetical protein
MTQRYPLIAAAVAAALASSVALSQPPALTSAASPTVSLNIAGSSAAQSGIANAISNDVCGGAPNVLTVQSNASSNANKNFFAYSCNTAQDIPAQGTGGTDVPSGTLVTIYYRTEGGSVVGALPIASGHTIARLNLSDGSCTASGTSGSCSITGVTSTNGPSDSWGPATVGDTVQLGVTDVEPGQLTGHDSPLALPYGNAPASVAYKTTAFGAATAVQMAGLTTVPLYQQVFGLVVNTSGESFSSVNLTHEEAAAILSQNLSDWSKVYDVVTKNPVASSSAPITNIDREYGSGTRTGANIFFEQYCYGGGSNFIHNNTNLNYSTGDDLTAANGTAGAITYTVIDQIQNPSNGTKYTNLVLATIDGVAPSNLNAANGTYAYWFEATLVPNPSLTGQAQSLATFLAAKASSLAEAPNSPAVDVIPGFDGNTTAFPTPPNNGATTATKTVYVNQFTRGGNSCNSPVNKY